MKNFIKARIVPIFGLIALLIVAPAFVQAQNDETIVQGKNLAEKLNWLKGSIQSNTSYIVEVDANENLAPYNFSYAGKKDISIRLKGSESERIVSLSMNGVLFKVGSGVTLILDNNVTLQGRSSNNDCLVAVDEGGTLVMKAGSKITGNNRTKGPGGGVFVWATLIMDGGEISGNKAENGGGVFIMTGGVFTMNDGKISGNTAKHGGGVNVVEKGTFIMNGGEISGNKADNGGGVNVWKGIFRIVNGTVYGSGKNGLINTAKTGAALLNDKTAQSETGTFDGTTWKSSGSLTTTNNTIKVAEGKLQ